MNQVKPAQVGIETLKQAIGIPLSLHMTFDKAKANDGKIDFADAPLLMEPLMKIFAFAANAGLVVPEFKDMDSAERDDLIAWARANYDIADDKIEMKVEMAIEILIKVSAFFA